MLEWLKENLLTIAILLVLAAAVFAIVFTMIRSKRKGRSSCGCNCAHCPMSGKCHQNN
jgi:hypothetical protein